MIKTHHKKVLIFSASTKVTKNKHINVLYDIDKNDYAANHRLLVEILPSLTIQIFDLHKGFYKMIKEFCVLRNLIKDYIFFVVTIRTK